MKRRNRYLIYCSRATGGKSGDCPRNSLQGYLDLPTNVPLTTQIDGYLCEQCAKHDRRPPAQRPSLPPELIARLEVLQAGVGPEGMTDAQTLELGSIMKEIMRL